MQQQQVFCSTLILLFLILVCSANNSNIAITEGKNTKVTIYERTASIERQFQIPIEITEHEKYYPIVVNKISKFLQPDSVILKVESQNQALQLLDYSAKNVVENLVQPDEKAKEQLLQLQSRMAQVNMNLQRYKKVNNFLESSIQSFNQGDANSIKEKLQLYLSQCESNDRKVFEYEEQIAALRKEAQELEPLANPVSKNVEFAQITINLAAAANVKAGKNLVTLTLTYSVSEASWTPYYAVRIDSNKLQGTIEFGTKIQQQTGEDWKNVMVVLSNAKPVTAAHPPSIEPIRASLQQPVQNEGYLRFGLQNSRVPASAAIMKESAPMAQFEAPPQLIQSTQSQITNVVTYEILKPLQLLSQNDLQRATIATEALPDATFEHLVMPSVSGKQVFMRVRVKNPSEMPLLAGAIDVFIDQQLISKTQLVGKQSPDTIQPNEEFELFLGKDKTVVFESKVTSENAEVGFLGFNAKLINTKKHAYKIDNKKGIPINITIIEAIPQPQQKELQLFLDQPNIKNAEHSSKDTDLVTLLSKHFKDEQVKDFVIVTTKQEYTTLNREYIWKSSHIVEAKSKHQTALEYRLEHPKSQTMSFF